MINDANQALWGRYGVESWPTLVLIDPNGNYLGSASGEGHREQLDRVIGELVAKHKKDGDLDTRPFIVRPESEKPHDSPLDFPGKITADAPGRRLFISDTGNNRIVVTDLKGKHIETIGNGQPGMVDGTFDKAQFNRPQGTYLKGETLFVADTESHAIRSVDLKARTVTTIAGTGEQSYKKPKEAPAKSTGLSSPWDIAPFPGNEALAIAMAGDHQIWKLDLPTMTIGVYAGTAREFIGDGPAPDASFAQPSGLATDGKHLFVADSEGSCVRSIVMGPGHKVTTLVGGHDFEGVLFNFGDVDGRAAEAKFQHCLGVAFAEGKLYIADTYNNKIKVCDPNTRVVQTFLGTRDSGSADSPAQFYEPGGLSASAATLFIADTNNHAIRAVDLKTSKVRTLTLEGVTPPPSPRLAPKFPRAKTIDLPVVKLAPGGSVALDLALAVPEGYKLNLEAPEIYLIEAPDSPKALGEAVSPTGTKLDPPKEKLSIEVPLAKPASAGESLKLRVSLAMFVCKKGSAGFCTVNNVVWNVPISFADDGEKAVSLKNDAK